MNLLETLHQWIEEGNQARLQITRERLAQNPRFPHTSGCLKENGIEILAPAPTITGAINITNITDGQCLDCHVIDTIRW